MARSYKETWVQDGGLKWRRYAKRLANKQVRRTANIPDGNAYRKVFNSYDIADYIWWVGNSSWYPDTVVEVGEKIFGGGYLKANGKMTK